MKYLLRQIGLYLTALWASLTLNFILPRMMPGDPVTSLIARMRGRLKPEEIEAIRIAYGFNNGTPLEQYFQYLSHALRGDFGISISAYPAKVSAVVSTGLMWTVLLGAVTLLLSFVIGTILGVIIAWRRGGVLDSVLPGLTSFIGSFPYFWLVDGGPVRAGIPAEMVPDGARLLGRCEPRLYLGVYQQRAVSHDLTRRDDHPGIRGRLDDRHAQHHGQRSGGGLHHHGRGQRPATVAGDV